MIAIRSSKLSIGVLGVVIGGGLLISAVAFAGHNEPKEAEELKTSWVRAFDACTLPTDTTPNLGLPACAPVPSDSVCGIDPNDGFGEVLTQSLDGDVKVQAVADKLTGCDGETLAFVATVRLTTDGCTSGGDCTAVDVSLPVGSCVVSGGKCEIDTTVNSEIPGALAVGNTVGFQVLGCGLMRMTGAGAPAQTLSCGILVE